MAGSSCMQEIVLSISSEDDSAHLWELRTATTLVSYRPAASEGAFARVGRDLFAVPQPSKASMHVFGWRKDAPHARCALPEKLTAMAVSADGGFMVGGGATGRVYLWEVPNGAMLRTWEAHYRAVTAIAFTDNGTHFVTGSEDSLLRVWAVHQILDYTSGHQAPPAAVHTWNLHTLPVTNIAVGVGGCGARVCSASMDRTVRVWHIPTGACLAVAQVPSPVTSLALHPCDETLFAGGSDGVIYSVDLVAPVSSTSGAPALSPVQSFVGHTGAISSLSMSFDGTMIVSASKDGTAKVWDCGSGQTLKTFTGHRGAVSCVCAMLRPPNLLDGPHIKIKTPFALLARRTELEDPSSAHFAGPGRTLPVLTLTACDGAPESARQRTSSVWDTAGADIPDDSDRKGGSRVRDDEDDGLDEGEARKWRKVAQKLHSFCVEKLAPTLVAGGPSTPGQK